jgi:AmmeMemoRadiSam system protein B/AmmeMemoRadiSam system protein A
MRKLLIIVVCVVILFSVKQCWTQKVSADRYPAVADQFYPATPNELAATIDDLFKKAEPRRIKDDVIAIIVPHAGYVFSGTVAASGFNQLDPNKKFDNVFVIGSSHQIAFDGASLFSTGDFITPLGTVKVNKSIVADLIRKNSVFSDRTDAHLKEHSLEVQLPFLQSMYGTGFHLVPIVLGTQSPQICRRIADALKPYLNLKNLFVISSDFSHYPSYEDAKKIDKLTAGAILKNSPEELLQVLGKNEEKKIPNLLTSLCGWTSVLTLLYMTHGDSNISAEVICYKNSGDSDYGDKTKVVGYNAVVFSRQQKNVRPSFELSPEDKKELLVIARKTINSYIKDRKIPEIDSSILPMALRRHAGAFVTLNKAGNLRGCIGRFDAVEPLYLVVQQMAVASSTEDYRFPPVTQKEINEIQIEISVLSPMRRVSSPDEIELGKHGIYIRKGSRSGTFLPQVATETGWTKEEFLGHCAQDKAGIGWDGWKDAELYIYEAYVFGEK